jgi:hypothetical protein
MRDQPRTVCNREQLAEHGAGIPIHMAEATLAVAPPGSPRNPGDDEGGLTTRRRSDLHERVL